MEQNGKLKVYCETSFWSYLNGGRTTLQHIAVKQAATLLWWEEIAPLCDIFVSQYVENEAQEGDVDFAGRRRGSMARATWLDGTLSEILVLADTLMREHAVPEDEVMDASHIATASVYGMDVLLTWNCRHMANPVTLPRTATIVGRAGYRCPIIVTPQEFLDRREEFSYER